VDMGAPFETKNDGILGPRSARSCHRTTGCVRGREKNQHSRMDNTKGIEEGITPSSVRMRNVSGDGEVKLFGGVERVWRSQKSHPRRGRELRGRLTPDLGANQTRSGYRRKSEHGDLSPERGKRKEKTHIDKMLCIKGREPKRTRGG